MKTETCGNCSWFRTMQAEHFGEVTCCVALPPSGQLLVGQVEVPLHDTVRLPGRPNVKHRTVLRLQSVERPVAPERPACALFATAARVERPLRIIDEPEPTVAATN